MELVFSILNGFLGCTVILCKVSYRQPGRFVFYNCISNMTCRDGTRVVQAGPDFAIGEVVIVITSSLESRSRSVLISIRFVADNCFMSESFFPSKGMQRLIISTLIVLLSQRCEAQFGKLFQFLFGGKVFLFCIVFIRVFFAGFNVGLVPSSRYQTGYKHHHHQHHHQHHDYRKPPPGAEILEDSLELVSDVGHKIRKGVRNKLKAIKEIIPKFPPPKYHHHHYSQPSYAYQPSFPSPSYESGTTSYGAPTIGSSYDSPIYSGFIESDSSEPSFKKLPSATYSADNPLKPVEITLTPDEITHMQQLVEDLDIVDLEEDKLKLKETIADMHGAGDHGVPDTADADPESEVEKEAKMAEIKRKRHEIMERRAQILIKNKYYDPRANVVSKEAVRRRPLIYMDLEVDGKAAGNRFHRVV